MPRQAKPLDLHELSGTTPQTVTPATSVIPIGRPKFPSYLTKEEKPVFKRVCKWLAARRTLTESDVDSIGLFAAAEARYRKFKAVLDAEGFTVQTEDGTKDHPLVKHFYAAERTMTAFFDRLGLDPSSKDKPKPSGKPADKPVDPLESLLQRGRTVPFAVPVPEVEDADSAEN